MAGPGAGQVDPDRPVSVALVMGHRLTGEMIQVVLHDAGVRVIGSSFRLDELPVLLELEPANVALVDHALPDGRGVAAIQLIRQRWLGCRVVFLTGFEDHNVRDEAIAAGADGILQRSDSIAGLVGIVRRAAAGDVLLDPSTLASLVRRRGSGRVGRFAGALNDRERDALEVLLELGAVGPAARRLGITESTYRVHIHHAMRKLGVASRLEAISSALRAGLIRPPGPRDVQPRRERTARGSGVGDVEVE
jgi:two-component system, NarL family, response regulator LiaR